MNNINGATVEIMWKPIVAIFLLLYIVRLLIDTYLTKAYVKIHNALNLGKLDGLEEKTRKLQKLCAVFSDGPYNKRNRKIYNGLCMNLATIAFVEQREDEFLLELDKVKKEEEFEWKAFLLALYYASKSNAEQPKAYYDKYLKCSHNSEHIRIIMEWLFSKDTKPSEEQLNQAISNFKNPMIIQLIRDNMIID